MKSYIDILLNFSFSKDTSDTSWLSSLPRAASSPPPPLSPPHATSLIGTARGDAPGSVVPTSLPPFESGDKLLQDRCTAILKENADLKAEIVQLHDFETGKKYVITCVLLATEEPAS